MPEFLRTDEFDETYFDGMTARHSHNAGYFQYKDIPLFGELAKFLADTFDLRDSLVLEVGCAKGFLVNHLRDQGVNCYGMDVSSYAIDCKRSKYIHQGDAVEKITGWYDVIISTRFLECLSDEDLDLFIANANSASDRQIHFTSSDENERFYAQRSLEDLRQFDWKPGTIVVNRRNWNNRVEI